MLSAEQFARAAALVPAHWSRRWSPVSGVGWELASRRTPFGEERYLQMQGVPSEVLGCRPEKGAPAPAAAAAEAAAAASAEPLILLPDAAAGHDDDEACAAPIEQPAAGPLRAGAAVQHIAAAAAATARASAAPALSNSHHHCQLSTPPAVTCTASILVPHPVPHLYDLHVVYHPSYRVPALLLRGYLADGAPLGMEAVRRDFGDRWREAARSAGSDWAFVAPEVHPVLQQPGWLMLHPCQTAEVMRLLLQTTSTAQQQQQQQQQQGAQQASVRVAQQPQAAAVTVNQAADDAGEGGVPDIDDLPPVASATCTSGLGNSAVEAAEEPVNDPAWSWSCQQQMQGGAVARQGLAVAADADEVLLLRYMEAWLRMVCPVVGLVLPVS